EEELFSLYAGHVQDMFRYGKLIPGKHQNDRLHNLCRQMIQGDEPEQETVQKTIGRYGWKIEEEYLVVVIRFFEEKGWDAQLKTTLPFLAVQLEQEWMGSCAVRSESEIILILNCEICMNRGKGKKDIQSAYGDLLQKMAYFVRDNVCRAGVSPVFHNFMELKQAGEAAREALRIGMVQEPELWYHLFDEIRLPYYIEQIRRELPDSMLVHPAVGVLDEYDRSQGTELALTLETFLESGMNMTKASERLYIHRTTFCRRMDHIRKLTGVNLEDPDTILSLQISYRIQKV
ncbi:MAG: helix-turn-helix domain-containing protein, partial [Lachnospiraceae bacterium]|nr:helix-turn-helix domain-containing protein [Lachnospiraceae bacterium]